MRWDWDFMFQTASTEAGDYTANAAAGRPRLRGDDVSEKRGVQTAFQFGDDFLCFGKQARGLFDDCFVFTHDEPSLFCRRQAVPAVFCGMPFLKTDAGGLPRVVEPGVKRFSDCGRRVCLHIITKYGYIVTENYT